MNYYHYRVFTTDATNSGNPAGVVTGFERDAAAMQAFSRQSGLPAVGFISGDEGAGYFVRFFYPETESVLCVHGALAVAKFLFDQKPAQKALDYQGTNKTIFSFKKEKGSIFLRLAQRPVILSASEEAFKMKLATQLLNLDDVNMIAPDLSFGIFSVGSAKWLIPMKSAQVLRQLKPNFEAIKAWSIDHKINGIYAYAQEGEHFVARNFNPQTGILEDAGTGVAAGALCSALQKNVIILQGDNVGLPSRMQAAFHSPQEIWVGGKIEMVLNV